MIVRKVKNRKQDPQDRPRGQAQVEDPEDRPERSKDKPRLRSPTGKSVPPRRRLTADEQALQARNDSVPRTDADVPVDYAETPPTPPSYRGRP